MGSTFARSRGRILKVAHVHRVLALILGFECLGIRSDYVFLVWYLATLDGDVVGSRSC